MTKRSELRSHYDAIVVGARVAGASTAMLLARAGLRVLVVDKARYGSDTLSTHALMRGGVMQLHRWGVLSRIVAQGTPGVRIVTFHYGDEAIEVPIQERDGVDALYAPRRTVLDSALADAAMDSGAQFMYNTPVDGILRDTSGRVCGVTITDATGDARRIEARVVIGADGVRSRVAREVEAGIVHEGHHNAVAVYGYWRGLSLNGIHWMYGKDVAAGAIPTNDWLTCVFVGVRPERYVAGFSDLDRLFTDVLHENSRNIAKVITTGSRVTKFYPFTGRRGYIRQSWGPGWALVGDAGCFKDPLTAHGMTDALRDAELLANAVIVGTDDAFAAYQSARDEFAVEFLTLSDEIASFDWDFDQVKVLHHRLSKLMGREGARIRAFDEPTVREGSLRAVDSIPVGSS